MSDKPNKKTNLASFGLGGADKRLTSFKGKIKEVWGDDRNVRSGLGLSSRQKLSSNKSLTEQIANAKSVEELRAISEEARSNQGYADIINYYKSMYHYRYTVVPVRKDISTKKNDSVLLEANKKMLTTVETINFEAVLPTILEKGLFQGFVALYVEKSGDSAITHILPGDFCKPFMSSSYGTTTVIFDLKYFEDTISVLTSSSGGYQLTDPNEKQNKKESLTKEVLDFFPKELSKAYMEYANPPRGISKDSLRYINLDMNKAAIIPFSASSAPPKINVAAAEENYHATVEIEKEKNAAGLEKIFTHQIPEYEGELLLSYTEARETQRALENALSSAANVKVVTTFGNANLHDMQKSESVKNETVSNAYAATFEAAYINPQLFRANTDYALQVSLNRDAAFMWDILQKIMIFYNLTINQQFNFGEYSCQINLLPITVYNEKDKVNEYRRSAEYGIGIMEAVVASGQKQISLLDKLELEQALGLEKLLVPLQSAHTRSAKDAENETNSDDKKKTEGDKNTSEREENADEVKNEKEQV